MGSYFSQSEMDECDKCLEFVEDLINDQEGNLDRLDCEIGELEQEYKLYTDEHEKMTTLSLMYNHKEVKKKMFTHLAQLKESRVRIRMLKSKLQDKQAIQRETSLLEKIKKEIANTEKMLIFNSAMTDQMEESIQLPSLDTLSDEEMLILRADMLKKDGEVHKTPEFVFVL